MPLTRRNILVIALALWAVLCYFICSWFTPFVGDDLLMWHNGSRDAMSALGVLKHAACYWLDATGRLGDMFNPLVYNHIPFWMLCLINGVMTGAFLLLFALWAGRTTLARVTAFCAAVILLPWCSLWMEFATAINYVWASAIILAALFVILNPKTSNLKPITAALLAAIAGAMHEASGVALSAGLFVAVIVPGLRAKLSRRQMLMTGAFVAGALFAALSPGIWGRVGAPLSSGFATPSIAWRLVAWNWPTMLLIVLTAALARKTRILHNLPFVVFATAAVASLVFSMPAGVGLRVTWFGQTFALIALWQLLGQVLAAPSRKCTAALVAITALTAAAQLAATALWQYRLGTQTRQAVEQYRASETGTVTIDYTPDSQVPWYVLRKVHGVPDADDSHYLNTLNTVYSHGTKRALFVRPSNPIRNHLPHNAQTLHRHNPEFGIPPLTIFIENNQMHIATPLVINNDTLWSIDTFDNDPGYD